jgi:hypothetical protein
MFLHHATTLSTRIKSLLRAENCGRYKKGNKKNGKRPKDRNEVLDSIRFTNGDMEIARKYVFLAKSCLNNISDYIENATLQPAGNF